MNLQQLVYLRPRLVRFPRLVTRHGSTHFPRLRTSSYRTQVQGQDFTCVSGHSCRVDAIRGTLLSDSDKYLLLETCGADDKQDLAYLDVLAVSASATLCHRLVPSGCADLMTRIDL